MRVGSICTALNDRIKTHMHDAGFHHRIFDFGNDLLFRSFGRKCGKTGFKCFVGPVSGNVQLFDFVRRLDKFFAFDQRRKITDEFCFIKLRLDCFIARNGQIALFNCPFLRILAEVFDMSFNKGERIFMIQVAVNRVLPTGFLNGSDFKCRSKDKRIFIRENKQRQNTFNRVA